MECFRCGRDAAFYSEIEIGKTTVSLCLNCTAELERFLNGHVVVDAIIPKSYARDD